jgi:hypothetical protein
MASWFEFLRIEADLAMRFIDAARLHSNPANAARSLGNARKALAEIQRRLMNPTTCGLSEDELVFLEQRRKEIEVALGTRWMLCAEHDALRQEHRAAVQNFRAAIRDLVVLLDSSAADSDFDPAHRRIRAACRACEVARDALDHHQAEHGCWNSK